MAVSNRDRVGRAFEALATGLSPYVDRRMKAGSPLGERWLAEWRSRERGEVSMSDPYFLLKVMAEAWDPAFKELTRADRNLVFELKDNRNRWAHNDAFSLDDTYRTLDSIERILAAIDAAGVEEVGRSKSELMRLRYETEARRAEATTAQTSGLVAGLRPWREVVVPHSDVTAEGRYTQAEFAANLFQVTQGQGRAEYSEPAEFFRRTYLTAGLRGLLADAARRLTKVGGAPVVDLQTTFGGGKTHSLIALWHLCSGRSAGALGDEVAALVSEAGVSKLPASVARAALVGTEIAPGQPSVKSDGTVVATLWGELAWQLGGSAGYALVAESDRAGTNPGGALRVLFETYSPCLVLVDEWVAYARQLYGRGEALPAGSWDTQFSFAQTLTETASSTEGVLVVVSLPASASSDSEEGRGSASASVELGGPGGEQALRRLRAVVGRTETSWRPASADEGFEIVRRRLFQDPEPGALADRDASVAAFARMYRDQPSEFPVECRDPAYERRLRLAYPIHPELFDRLYEEWSTLERFQRTRGVLRLMALVVGELWRRGDASPMILPGSVPLDDPAVAGELAHTLDDQWTPVMDTDVDGSGSLPAELDRMPTAVGRQSAARRVARTVFLGSAPSVHSPNRGVDSSRVRLGCAQPRDVLSAYGDALTRLSDRATYLYVDQGRYWYGLSPSVTRLARERAERLLAASAEELDPEIVALLRSERDRGGFAGVHVVSRRQDEVEDDDRVRLVILAPEWAHVGREADSPAVRAASGVLAQRGTSPRLYRNMVVFLAADEARLGDLRQGMAESLAWESVAAEAEELGLGAQQSAQARSKATEATDTASRRLAEAYVWALVPTQAGPTAPVVLAPVKVEGQGPPAVRVGSKLAAQQYLCAEYGAAVLRNMVLDGPLASVWEGGHVEVGEVWDALARYPYLPRLRDSSVLSRAVSAGPASLVWQVDGFAVAEGFDRSTGRYLGLVTSGQASGVGAGSLIVRPERALAQLEADEALAGAQLGSESRVASGGIATQPVIGDGGKSGAGAVSASGPAATGSVGPPAPARPRRFYGVVGLSPERVVRDFNRVAEEVITHLTGLVDTDVEITVEVRATRAGGFPEGTERTVSENARTLRFTGASFEEQ